MGPEEGEPVGLAVGVTELIVGLGDTDGEAGADVGVAGAEVEADGDGTMLRAALGGDPIAARPQLDLDPARRDEVMLVALVVGHGAGRRHRARRPRRSDRRGWGQKCATGGARWRRRGVAQSSRRRIRGGRQQPLEAWTRRSSAYWRACGGGRAASRADYRAEGSESTWVAVDRLIAQARSGTARATTSRKPRPYRAAFVTPMP